MTKPTFMQSLLNQPSQSYSYKQHMSRSTTTDTTNTRSNRQQQMAPPPLPPPSPHQLRHPPPTAYRHRQSYNEFEELEPSEDSDLEDLFFTPNTSPRTSMASSLLMFPTGRKPSRRSLRLSASSDTVFLADVAAAAAAARVPPSPSSPTLSPRAPFSSSTQNRQQHPRHIHTPSSASTTSSLEPRSSVLSVGSVEPPIHHANTSPAVGSTAESDDKKQGHGGTTTKRTRHGLVTIKQNPTATATESVKSTTTTATTTPSKRKNSQQGLADGDVTKDAKRSTPSSTPPPVVAASKRKSTQQGPADGDVTKDVKRSVPSVAPGSATSNGSAVTVKITTTTTTAGGSPPKDPPSRKLSKSQTSANSGLAASSKEKMKQDVVVVETEKGKQVDSSTPPSSSKLRKDKGREKEKTKTTPAQTQTAQMPKPTPHTFSAFAPLPDTTTTTPSSVPPANGNANDSNDNINNNRSSLPPAGFSFPPPPPHSPQQPQPQRQSQSQQPKNSLNGSAAAITYALRQKGNSSPKPSGNVGSNWMNMAALLEEDEVDAEGDIPARRGLRRMPNGGNAQGKGKGKEKRRISDSTSSRSDSSSHHSYSASHSRSNAYSHPTTTTTNSNTQSQQSQSHSDSSTFRSPPKTLTSEVNAMSLSTPGELPSKGTQGYNNLVLPRAPLPHSGSIRSGSTSGSGSRKWFGGVGKEGKIDLTRSGVAQTTMASVEVIRGLGRQQGQRLGGKLMGMLRRRSTSGSRPPRPIEGLGSKPVDDAGENPPAKVTSAGVEGTVLGFTSHRKPPGYVPSSSVLVQVWAVGVDGVDGRLVGVNFGDHVWRERGVGGFEDEETGVETEWEKEVRKGEESEEIMDVSSRSTPQQGSGLSGLGRSLSLKMSRTKKRGSIAPPSQQQDSQQAANHGRPTPSSITTERQKPSRAFSLKRKGTVQPSPSQPPLEQQQNILHKSSSQKQATQRHKILQKATHRADVGYIPGRSFVGRVLECGWDVKDEEVRKGEWVVGLLDIKKCGALTEFIVVDRHRIHRVPHPRKSPHQQGNGHPPDMGPEIPFQDDENDLTLEELALLPLCGIPAYRAVRTFIYAFSSLGEGGSMASPISTVHDRNRGTNNSKMATTEHPQGRRRRVLVLRGHDGVGAMAVQLLAKRGWEVSVHVPFSASSTTYDPTTTDAEHVDPFPKNIQERARDWGADEIIFDEEAGEGIDDGRIAAIRVMESLREDGDMFDAILDTVGGKEVREAGERLLRSAGVATATSSLYGNEPPMSPRGRDKAKGVGQFTTLVGDVPERPIPTTADHFRAGLRSFGVESGVRNGDEGTAADMRGNKVGYAWVSVAQDVDWEGEDISETLSSVLRLALDEHVRPVIGARYRIVPFEQAPYVFVDKGPLGHGCNVVVKIAG